MRCSTWCAMASSGGHCRWTSHPGTRCTPSSNVGTNAACPTIWLIGRATDYGVRARRDAQPSAAIVDSQAVKATETVSAGSRGFDSGKKINGRKRHIAVDVEGSPLAVVVTAANIGDRMGAKLLVIALLKTCSRLKLIRADAGYDGTVDHLDRLGRRCHSAGHQTHRAARVPGCAAQVGGGTQFRVVVAVPAVSPRLRTAYRASRGDGVLGHRVVHDTQTGPPPERPTSHPALGSATFDRVRAGSSTRLNPLPTGSEGAAVVSTPGLG